MDDQPTQSSGLTGSAGPGGSPTASGGLVAPLQSCTSLTHISAARAMSCRLTHSSGPWISCMPVNRFGVGTPSSVRREPSVPPRIGVEKGSTPICRQASRASSTGPHVVLQPIAHVAVLRRDRAADPGAWLGGLDRRADLPEQVAVSAQATPLEVAQDEVQLGRGGGAAHLVDVDEALAAVGGFGRAA